MAGNTEVSSRNKGRSRAAQKSVKPIVNTTAVQMEAVGQVLELLREQNELNPSNFGQSTNEPTKKSMQ